MRVRMRVSMRVRVRSRPAVDWGGVRWIGAAARERVPARACTREADPAEIEGVACDVLAPNALNQP